MNRFALSIRAWWKALTDPDTAGRIEGALTEAPAGPDLRVLALMQRDGRLVDFLKEDIEPYTDEQVGAAVRDIHKGCRKVLNEYLTVVPVLPEGEGQAVTVAAGFDPAAVRLLGNVTGQAPYRGTLKHHGWRVAEARLPAAAGDNDGAAVLAPAEVELS